MPTALRLIITITTLGLLLTSACGYQAVDELSPELGGKADTASGEQAPLPKLLDGGYALTITSVTRSRHRKTKELSVSTTRLLGLVTATQRGSDAKLSVRVCELLLPSYDGRQPSLDRRLYRRLPPIQINGHFSRAEGGEISFTTGLAPLTLGLALEHPLRDPLPGDVDSQQVVDQDNDGSPGVSVSIGWFEIYVAVRLRARLSAKLTLPGQADEPEPGTETKAINSPAPDDQASAAADPANGEPLSRLRGTLALELDQQIYGDNIPFVDAAKRIAAASASYRTISQQHRFELRAVTAASCDELPPL